MSKQTSKSFGSDHKRSSAARIRLSIQKLNSIVDQESIIQYGVGFDVHKFKISLCLSAQLKTGDILEVKEHVFRADPKGISEILNFVKKYSPIGCFLMECTGVYHLPLYHALQDEFGKTSSQIIAMNPLLLNRRLTDLGRHSDKADARGMASLSFYRRLLRPSYIGSTEFFCLRDLMRSYHKLQSQITGCRNRLHRGLSAVNFKGPLDLKMEWGLMILDRWISKNWSFSEAYNARISELESKGRSSNVLRKHIPEFEQYEDFKLPAPVRFSLQLQLSRYLYVEALAATYLRQAERSILEDAEFSDHYSKLLQIPGIAAVTALTVLVELGNFHRFESWKAMVKYCGVVPMINESGEFKAKGHVNRYTNAYLRKVLSQAGGVLINRSKKDSDLPKFAYYQFRVKKLPYKKAILKVAHKLARTIYSVLVLQVPYDRNYETTLRMERMHKNRLAKQGTLMNSRRTRALRRDVQDFLVSHYDFLNSTSKYHLVAGFNRMITKARWVDRSLEIQTKDEEEGGKKKKKTISKGG